MKPPNSASAKLGDKKTWPAVSFFFLGGSPLGVLSQLWFLVFFWFKWYFQVSELGVCVFW